MFERGEERQIDDLLLVDKNKMQTKIDEIYTNKHTHANYMLIYRKEGKKIKIITLPYIKEIKKNTMNEFMLKLSII